MSGVLYYVVGPSGCGKDSVMEYARLHCSPGRVAFAHRYITRPPDAGGENHVYLPPGEFQARLDAGFFALSWDSHGWRYAVGVEIDLWMQGGVNVVVNGSRAYLPEAVRRYPGMVPVCINVSTEILRERLKARGRENAEEIERRLERAAAFGVEHKRLVTIDNGGSLSEAGNELLRVIEQ